MEHTKPESIPGILVSLDFRKAFDSLEWSFMMKALDIFNFGTSIKRWISTFYTKIESAAINNGFMTNWFRPSRRVRQGFPFSPYLFVLSTEILSSKIRQEPSITGIKIFGHEIKLSQFADDTNVFCQSWGGAWIGILRNQRDDKLYWIDGTPVAGGYTAWTAGNPSNNGGREDCGHIMGYVGAGWEHQNRKWNDVHCNLMEPNFINNYPVILCEKSI